MAFVVEDGTGLNNSNSYVSVDTSDEIAERLLFDPQEWTGIVELDKQRYLQRATITVDSKNRWSSKLLEDDQALGFPREQFRDNEGRLVTGIPMPLKEAVVMLAVHEALNGESAFKNQPSIKSESYGRTTVEYTGPISESEGDAYVFMKRLRLLGYASTSSVVDVYRA